ncbi:MAG: hypothetical protein IKM10_01120 [Bacteroidaceae bacterium]|nr:hypothetical protein [Bacteroidaceae bacterium]
MRNSATSSMLMPCLCLPTSRFATLNVGLIMCNVFDVNALSVLYVVQTSIPTTSLRSLGG